MIALAVTAIVLPGCGLTGGGESGRLVVDYMQSGSYDKAAEAQAKDYEASHDGVAVRVLAFPYAQLRQQNTTDLVSGTCKTDMMSGSYYLAPVYDKFRPLTDFIEQDGYGKGLIPGLWKASEYHGGQRIGIPYGADSYAMMYRTDLFEEAGLQLPTTWPQFIQALKTLRAKFGSKGISPFVFAGGAPEQAVAMLFAGYDGYFVDANGKYALDPAKATQAIELGQRLLSYAPENFTGLSIDQANAQFLNGKAATMYGFPSFIGKQANDDPKSKVAGKWAVMPNPQPGLTWLSLWQEYIPKCSEHADEAWSWMMYGSTPERDKLNFEKYGIGPVYSSTYQDPEIKKQYGNWLLPQAQNLDIAKNPPLTGEAQDYLASTLGKVFTGDLSPEQAVDQVNERWATLPVPADLKDAAQRSGLVAGQ